jgi:hypothetical protein
MDGDESDDQYGAKNPPRLLPSTKTHKISLNLSETSPILESDGRKKVSFLNQKAMKRKSSLNRTIGAKDVRIRSLNKSASAAAIRFQ